MPPVHAILALVAKGVTGAGHSSSTSSSSSAASQCCLYRQVHHCVKGVCYAGSAAVAGCGQAAAQAASDAMNGCVAGGTDCFNAASGMFGNTCHECTQGICGSGPNNPCGDACLQLGNCFQNALVDLWYCDPCLNQQCGWLWWSRGSTGRVGLRQALLGDGGESDEAVLDDVANVRPLDAFGERQRIECYSESDCQICAEEYSEQGSEHERAQLRNCGHVLCKTCAREIQSRRRRCPVCRRIIYLVDTNLPPPSSRLSVDAESAPHQQDLEEAPRVSHTAKSEEGKEKPSSSCTSCTTTTSDQEVE